MNNQLLHVLGDLGDLRDSNPSESDALDAPDAPDSFIPIYLRDRVDQSSMTLKEIRNSLKISRSHQ